MIQPWHSEEYSPMSPDTDGLLYLAILEMMMNNALKKSLCEIEYICCLTYGCSFEQVWSFGKWTT